MRYLDKLGAPITWNSEDVNTADWRNVTTPSDYR